MKIAAAIFSLMIFLAFSGVSNAERKTQEQIENELALFLHEEGFVPDRNGRSGDFDINSFKKSIGEEYWMFASIARNVNTGLIGSKVIFPPNTALETQIEIIQEICSILSNNAVSDYEVCCLWGILAVNWSHCKDTRITCGDFQYRTSQESGIKELIIEQTYRLMRKKCAD